MIRLKAGTLYFAIAFAAGFAFGAMRELALVPRFGADLALAMEAPAMALVSFLAGRWVLGRIPLDRLADRLGMSAVALGLLILAEDLLTRAMRGGSIFEHWATFTPLAHAINIAGLVIFVAMPLLVRRR